MTPTNWIEGPNPYGMAKPPDYFLTDMAVFDAELVIFPSAEQPCYRLCRRVKRAAPISFVGKMRNKAGAREDRFDHKVLVKAKLVPVISLQPFPQWGPKILSDLALADVWRHGGADKAADTLDARDRQAERATDIQIADEASARAHAAWSAYKWGSGQRLDLGNVRIPRLRPSTSRPIYRTNPTPLQSADGSAIVSENRP
jgi:hypothetical protein